MKKTVLYSILLLTVFSIIIAGCKSEKPRTKGDQLAQAKTELRKLESDAMSLKTKIDSLNVLIAKLDTTKTKGRPIYVHPIVPKSFTKYISLQGTVDARSNVIANPQSPGVIKSIAVRTGQHVSAGQVLAYLDDNVLTQGVKELDQQIEFANNIYLKQKNLWDQNIGTEVQLLTAKNNYEALLKKKNTTLAQKGLYVIKSPITGVIDAVDIKVGEMASPGYPKGIRVVSDQDLNVNVGIGEGYINVVNNGDKVKVIFPDLKDTINASIRYVSKTISSVSRSFNAEINIPSSPKYKPNMIVEVRISGYHNPKAIVVQSGMVQRDPDGDFVMVIRDNKVAKARVTVGESYNGEFEIKQGLKTTDKLITMGFQGLVEGDPFEVVEQ